MNDFDDYLCFVGLAVSGALVAVPLLYGRARSERWGDEATKEQVSGAPFRGGEVTRRTPRAAPGWVKLVAGANAAWAIVTLLLFTPSWLILVALTADTSRTPFGVIALSLVVVDGLIWPFAMVLATRRLLLRRRLSGVQRAIRWSYVHHGFGLFAALLATGSTRIYAESAVVLTSVGWAATGSALAWGLGQALSRARALTAELGDAVEAE